MDMIETSVGGSSPTRQDDDPHVSGRPVVLRAGAISKRFGGSIALRGAALELRAGEVHALIGENGSGKSTLLGIISGQTRADIGEVNILSGGEFRVVAGRTSDVAIVTQELSLAPDLSVAENIMMGRHTTGRGPALSWRALRAAARSTLDMLGVDLDVKVPVGRLRVDQQQMVEIARAIQQDAPILILDEPTSSLTAEAAIALFESISVLRARGVAVVLVSHRLEELLDIADRFTVLRDGVTVSTGARAEYDRDRIIMDMVGHAPEQYESSASADLRDGEVALRIEGLTLEGRLHDLSLDLRSGEALGILGLSGAGQTELLECVFGVHPDARGTIECGGTSRIPLDSREAMSRGVALVPNDRKNKGLFLQLSPTDNISIAKASTGLRLGRVKRRREAKQAQQWAARFSIKGENRQHVSELSGGNQQKVLLSKWLCMEPSVLLLDEPTRGVDVGAKSEIHRIIHQTREAGMALIVSSSEIEELLLLCDRILVLFRGSVVGTLSRAEATEARLTHMATEGRR